MDSRLTKIPVWNKMVVMYFTKPSRLTVDPEKTGRRQDTEACGNMTPSVHFQEASVLVGAKCWRNISAPGPLSKKEVDIYISISKQVPKSHRHSENREEERKICLCCTCPSYWVHSLGNCREECYPNKFHVAGFFSLGFCCKKKTVYLMIFFWLCMKANRKLYVPHIICSSVRE